MDPRGAPRPHGRAPSTATAVSLAAYTTLRVGGPAARMVTVTSEPELVATLAELDAAGEPVLVLGGGSNLLVADEGFPGTVVRIDLRGISTEADACSGATLRWPPASRGTTWSRTPWPQGWIGLEALSGIPGLTGATPIQNVGAYGAEVSDVITQVRTLDRATGRIRTFFAVECGFGYRTSRFKHPTAPGDWPGRYVVARGDLPAPAGRRCPRRSATPSWPGRWASRWGSARRPPTYAPPCWPCGPARAWCWPRTTTTPGAPGRSSPTRCCRPRRPRPCRPEAPRFPQPDGRVKTSAAWLIEHAGFGKGYGAGPARLSGKHTLALTNRGTAEGERRAGPGPRGPGRRTREVRRHPGPGTGPGGV